MSDTAIRVENLGKRYQLGASKSGSFRESFTRAFRSREAGSRKPDIAIPDSSFWALQDINFEIKRGEAVGIIGRNGAGKSTLLKILSRITEPTTGRFEVFGRVSSLLEVGTGFHPELTGRENVYLNGTILGMKRREVKAKFDEIVAFSGVEKFIDTPVKHYSSGMQVRLAFAVAAHLEPEILIIDEVLAVGDAEFQKKCLGKMEDVTGEGRTVLFVSHNMGAIKQLCTKGVLLHTGRVEFSGTLSRAINMYINADSFDMNKISLDKYHDDLLRYRSISLTQKNEQINLVQNDEPLCLVIEYEVLKPIRGFQIYFDLCDSEGEVLLRSMNYEKSHKNNIPVAAVPGCYIAQVVFPRDFFVAGDYTLVIHSAEYCVRKIAPESGININFTVEEFGKYRRVHYPRDKKGKLTLPFKWEISERIINQSCELQ